MPDNSVSRKDFVALVGTVAAAEVLPGAAEAATEQKRPKAAAPLGNEPEAYAYLTQPEAAFVEAAVERLIPTDELGPGAREAGVAFFIDQQLGGEFGYAAKMYMQGPWAAGLPTQGYQLPLTPREVYRLGIAATNEHCRQQYGKTFDRLSAEHQDNVLTALENATLSFDAVPARTFFEMLYENTLEGFFADPLYGGNRGKIGWKLVGFPGAAAAYISFIEKHNVPYKVEPVSIADVQEAESDAGHAAMDEMRMHIELARKSLGVK
jgi:gluconate 2-dehydrogenase gamma chain